jgi:hypothetical protein
VTLIANYIPLQEPSGGPQWFRFDDNVLYEIKVDNTGDGVEDVTYQFQFATQTVNSNTVLGQSTVNENGVISNLTDPDYNMPQTYSVRRIDRFTVAKAASSRPGLRTPPAKHRTARHAGLRANLGPARGLQSTCRRQSLSPGQRDEYFYIDLGVFDALNLRRSAFGRYRHDEELQRQHDRDRSADRRPDKLAGRSGRTDRTDAVIGVWATASRQTTTVIQNNGNRITAGQLAADISSRKSACKRGRDAIGFEGCSSTAIAAV